MKFCNFVLPGVEENQLPTPGVLINNSIYPLHLVLKDPVGLQIHSPDNPLPVGFRFGEVNNLVFFNNWVRQLETPVNIDTVENYDPERTQFAPPVYHINSFRDFYSFEAHVKTARRNRGLEMVDQWYKQPVFYYSNHNNMITHGDGLFTPLYGKWLDYELEVAAIVTTTCRNVGPEEAETAIGGFCVLNDWSLRDVQHREMKVGLGPAKGKDFATGLGPWIVTSDELEDRRTEKGYDLKMTARRNGKLLSEGNWKDIFYSFGEMISLASRDCAILPGDVIGSGTVGTGCILEIGSEKAGGWLQHGDEIELEIERLGIQNNLILK